MKPMKNICTFLIATVMLLSLAACGDGARVASPTSSEIADNNATVESTESSIQEEQSDQQTSSAGVQVDEGLFNVKITLPASYFENMTDFNPDTYSKENGFKETIVNDDGSITITMSKTKHNEIMTEMKESIDQTFMELIESDNTPYIKDVTSSEGYTIITVDVDKAGYEESAFDLTPFMIGILVMMYQQFDGSELHCEVLIRDVASGETLKSVVYPDALNN
jgi:predicted small lipoprotein YifL